MPPDPHAIHISTDGSCYKNPGGRSGCAAIVHYPDHLDREDEQIVDFGCDESSNNRMELLACICVLKWIRENGPWDSVSRVQIFTDSQYVKDNLFRAREWKKSDWRNQHGEPRENSDLWNQLLSPHAKARITVHFEWTGSKILLLMPASLQVRLGSQGFGVSGSFARSELASPFQRLWGRVPHSERRCAK